MDEGSSRAVSSLVSAGESGLYLSHFSPDFHAVSVALLQSSNVL